MSANPRIIFVLFQTVVSLQSTYRNRVSIILCPKVMTNKISSTSPSSRTCMREGNRSWDTTLKIDRLNPIVTIVFSHILLYSNQTLFQVKPKYKQFKKHYYPVCSSLQIFPLISTPKPLVKGSPLYTSCSMSTRNTLSWFTLLVWRVLTLEPFGSLTPFPYCLSLLSPIRSPF